MLAPPRHDRNVIGQVRRYLARDGLGPVLVKAVSGSAGLRIAGMAFGFLIGVQLARGLGAQGYGVYGLAMSILAMLTVPTEFGLPQLITREVAVAQVHGEWAKVHGILRWSLRTSLLIAGVIAAVVISWLFIWGNLRSPLGSALLPGIVMIPFVAMLSQRSAALRGAQQIVKGQLAEVAVRPALHSLLIFIAAQLFIPLTPTIAMWLGAASALGAWFLADWHLNRALPRQALVVPVTINPSGWWSSALPMAMTEGMRLLQGHLLIFLLGGMASMIQLGLFRMAVSTVALVAMPISLFNIVCMPLIANLHASDSRAKMQRMLTLISLGMTVGVVLLCLPFFIAGEWLLGRAFGAEFASGNTALLLLSASVIIDALFGASAALLTMLGHQRRVTAASLFALVVLVVAGIPLVYFYGMHGAAIANLCSVTAWKVLMWLDCRRLLGFETGVWRMLWVTR